MASIKIRRLKKAYARGQWVIDGLDLEIGEGEFVSLLGPSGCGKTTTLRCVAGLEQANDGQIWIGDRLVSSPSEKVFVAPHKRNIGMVFQNYALWPHMSVAGNVEYPLKVRKAPRAERKAAIADALQAVGLTAQMHRPATLLSGGQQQRVALARAMVGAPKLLLFDEPLSNLDAQLRNAMRKEIRRVHDKAGVASLFVTHDQLEATELSDRILVMRAGTIEQMGSPRDLYRTPISRFVAEFVGYENFVGASVTSIQNDVASFVTESNTQLWCKTRRRLSLGQRVDLAIRSKDVKIHTQLPADRPNVQAARLTAFIYSGDELRYELQLPETSVRAVRSDDLSNPSLELHPGPQDTPMFVEFPPESIVVLPFPADTGTPRRGGMGEGLPVTVTRDLDHTKEASHAVQSSRGGYDE